MQLIERVRPEHLPRLVELERQLFADDSPWTHQMFADELAAGGHYVVWVQEGMVLGYAGLAFLADDLAEVRTIGVDQQVQGQGIGRQLLRELLNRANSRDVLLEVRTDNTAALALYDSEGFVRQGIRRGYYQPSGADAYNMVRRLT